MFINTDILALYISKLFNRNSFNFPCQILRTQIKRFFSHELVEYDKNVNPKEPSQEDDGVRQQYLYPRNMSSL